MSSAAVPVGGDGRMPLVEHLRELRSRIIKVVIALSIGMVAGFLLYNQIFDVLVEPYKQSANSLTNGKLLGVDPLEGFAVRLKISLYAGIFFAMPVILWQLWRFITPGLY